jgi:hypothetical protein
MGNDINNQLKIAIRQDNSTKLIELIEKSKFPVNGKIGKKERTLIILSVLYKSPNCLKSLIELGNDINIPELQDQSTPFLLASKFNYIEIMEILLKTEKCDVNKLNNLGLNCLDVAILRGNYEASLYIIQNTNLKPEKNLESYKILNKQLEYPLFNMDLFFQNLMEKIPIEKVPNFSLPKKRKHQFDGKVPDPNESWSNFVKRLAKFELYQPPLVDKEKVGAFNSLYMKVQSSLIENEYGVKIDLNNNKNEDIFDQSKNKLLKNNNDSLNIINDVETGNNNENENDSKKEDDNDNEGMGEINTNKNQFNEEQVLKIGLNKKE